MSESGPNSVVPVMSAARPLFPRKRTSIRDLASLCHVDQSGRVHEPLFPGDGVRPHPLSTIAHGFGTASRDVLCLVRTAGEHHQFTAAVRLTSS